MGISLFWATRIAPRPTIFIVVDLQPDTYLCLTMAQFLGIVEDKATISTSTCEPEYIAQTETACEAVWIRGLLGELGILETTLEEGYPKTIAPPTTIFADNQGAVKLTENPEYHRKIKQIPIKYHKTWELVAEGVVHFEWIPTNEMVADGLTMLLGIRKFKEFVEMLGMIDR